MPVFEEDPLQSFRNDISLYRIPLSLANPRFLFAHFQKIIQDRCKGKKPKEGEEGRIGIL
ncbi:hypothetical protein BBR01nite_34120 [Brevibacillus brevis]|nr:hypothetical protein BBR01nite_34120 [Brevibacillus brevis]